MLNYDGDIDGNANANVKCEQSLRMADIASYTSYFCLIVSFDLLYYYFTFSVSLHTWNEILPVHFL